MRLIWTTDIHWDRVNDRDRAEFFADVAELQGEGLIVSGDIGEAPSVIQYLSTLQDGARLPIYFVLGNHDFYDGSFAAVRDSVRKLVAQRSGLHWLTESQPLTIAPGVALVGHEGWADARLGDYAGARQWPRDFQRIEDFQGLSKENRLTKLRSLGDEATAELRPKLIAALADHSQVLCVTHVPPFRETCVDGVGRVNEERLPFYTCDALGEMFLEVMARHPEKQLTVLCGHTHEECDVSVRLNIRARVKGSEYGISCTPSLVFV